MAEQAIKREYTELRTRQQIVDSFIAEFRFEKIRELMKGFGDLERIAARIGLRTARPRDLTTMRYPGVTSKITDNSQRD